MKQPLLSVLIPAYNFPHGVARAIASMGCLSEQAAGSGVEILVSDDSNETTLAVAIEKAVAGCKAAAYVRNQPPLGAVRNWNALLQRANGQYCLILHHDEYFESPAAFAAVLRQLTQPRAADCIVLACKIVDVGQPPRRHMPKWLVQRVLQQWPGYLFRRNVIGSPSVLIVRRTLYEPFDDRLRWFVDVELYVRVLTKHQPRSVVLDGPGIVSDASLASSITKTLRGQLGNIRSNELSLLAEIGSLQGRAAWLLGGARTAKVARSVEAGAWAMFRMAWHLRQLLGRIATRQRAAWRFKA